MPVLVRHAYYCFHKCAEQLLWLAQVSLYVLQHIQIKVYKHCLSSKIAIYSLEEGTF